MPDKFSTEQRSAIMSRIKSSNSKPEQIVRSLLHKMGYRFRLQRKELPGTPDIVLPKYQSVIFVHGCFWHSHPTCPRARRTNTRTEFWDQKLARSIERDQKVQEQLRIQGWRVLIVWQCELWNMAVVKEKLQQFLQLPENT